MARRTITRGLAAGVAALFLAVGGAGGAAAAGKGSIQECYDGTISTDKRSATIVCDEGLGNTYYFQVQCSWYSAGQGGSFWHSSNTVSNGQRATAICPGGSYVTAFGATTYYQ